MLLGARYGIPTNISHISDHSTKLSTYKGHRYCAMAVFNTAYELFTHLHILEKDWQFNH